MMPSASTPTDRILIVDDDPSARETLEIILENDFDLVCAEDGLGALEWIGAEPIDLVLLDLRLPDLDGIEVLSRIKTIDAKVDVIIVSATDRAGKATEAFKAGACDYITKPFSYETIRQAIETAIKQRARVEEPGQPYSHRKPAIICQSEQMNDIIDMIAKVAPSGSNVLIWGESGTGKDLIAREIHRQSPRNHNNFVAINCAAIPTDLVESELFGFEKGSFTGAYRRSLGKFEFAHGGTLFLDEVASLKPETQAKLLRFLQNREFSRVGNNNSVKVNIRLIAATNTRLDLMVSKQKFREDLYYRLNVIPIDVPALRERRDDIPLLANHFLTEFCGKEKKSIKGFTPNALNIIKSYAWPGNARELQNLIERLVVLTPDNTLISTRALPLEMQIQCEADLETDIGRRNVKGLLDARKAFERKYILKALKRCRWNQSQTAAFLDIHRNTLISKMKQLGLHPKMRK